MTITYVSTATASSAFPAARDSVTVAKPTGTTNNDIVLVLVRAYVSGGPVITPPAGFTLVGNLVSGNRAVAVYWHRAASDPTSYTFTTNGGGLFDDVCALATAYRGCRSSGSPVDVSSSVAYEASDAWLRAAGVTTTAANDLVVFLGAANAGSATPPLAMTERKDIELVALLYQADRLWASPGATGSFTAQLDVSTTAKAAHLVALLVQVLRQVAVGASLGAPQVGAVAHPEKHTSAHLTLARVLLMSVAKQIVKTAASPQLGRLQAGGVVVNEDVSFADMLFTVLAPAEVGAGLGALASGGGVVSTRRRLSEGTSLAQLTSAGSFTNVPPPRALSAAVTLEEAETSGWMGPPIQCTAHVHLASLMLGGLVACQNRRAQGGLALSALVVGAVVTNTPPPRSVLVTSTLRPELLAVATNVPPPRHVTAHIALSLEARVRVHRDWDRRIHDVTGTLGALLCVARGSYISPNYAGEGFRYPLRTQTFLLPARPTAFAVRTRPLGFNVTARDAGF